MPQISYHCPSCGEGTPHMIIVRLNETTSQIKCTRCATNPFCVEHKDQIPTYDSKRVEDPPKLQRQEIAYLFCDMCNMKQIGTKHILSEHPTYNVAKFKCRTCNHERTNVVLPKY